MIGCILHSGSGAGDQLMRYITVRTLAEEKGYDFGVVHPENFKCKSFMNLSLPEFTEYTPNGPTKWEEKEIRENGIDVRSYDPNINFIKDGTILDGCFEDRGYWSHNLVNIREWLSVEKLERPDDLCVISHRGGEYKAIPELYLPDAYWHFAVARMRDVNPHMRFEVQTDDFDEATRIFPDFQVVSEIGHNWRSIRFAKFLIVSNSAFSIIPSLIGEAHIILAPKYHARHNIGVWARPSSYYKRYHYIDPKDYL